MQPQRRTQSIRQTGRLPTRSFKGYPRISMHFGDSECNQSSRKLAFHPKNYYDPYPSKRTHKEYNSLLPVRQSTNSHLAELGVANPELSGRPLSMLRPAAQIKAPNRLFAQPAFVITPSATYMKQFSILALRIP